MKKMLIALAVILAAILVLAAAKDLIIKTSVENGVEFVTGLKLSMASLRAGIINTVVDIKNLRLFNPAGFLDRTMLVMPEIYVNYNLPAILGGKIHLPEARIAMKEFLVVKNADGKLNIDSLKVVQAQKTRAKPAGKAPEIQIDKLTLKIGKVTYKDYTKDPAPYVQEFNINLSETYTNIDNPYKLVSLIIVKALMNTTIAQLTNFDLSGLTGNVSDILSTAQKAMEAVGKAHQVAAEGVKQATTSVKAAQEVAAKTGEAAKETVDALKEVFKSPFGK